MCICESQNKMPNNNCLFSLWPKIDFCFFSRRMRVGWKSFEAGREREREGLRHGKRQRERAIFSLLIYIFHEKSIPILTQRGNTEKISLPGSKALMCLITKDLCLPQNWKWSECLLQGITPLHTFSQWKFATLNQICISIYICVYTHIYSHICIVLQAFIKHLIIK